MKAAEEIREHLRTIGILKTIVRDSSIIRRHMLDVIGDVQLMFGHEPTVVGTPRLALEQWKYMLRDVNEPQTGQLLIAAIRNKRWVEWAIFSGCYLLRMGYQPTIMFSTALITRLYGKADNSFWAVAQKVPHFHWIDLDEYMAPEDVHPEYDEFARDYAHTIAAYNLGVEEYEPDQAPNEYERELVTAEMVLRRYSAAAENVLKQYPTLRLICPSGLIGESAAIYEAARRLKHDAVYVEGWALRPGHNMWNINKPALEYDVEGWLRYLGEWTDELEQDSQDYIAFREGNQINREGWLDNFHQVQRATIDTPLPPRVEAFTKRNGPLVFLGTNVIGDSSTLRRQTIFRSQEEWLKETIAFFKDHPELNLIVRAHPDEIWARARLRLAEIARGFAGDSPNICIVGSEDQVNTYSLVDRSSIGLAWVSNIGLDMALRGIPVVMGAKPKYAGLGIVHEPTSRNEYFRLIIKLVDNPVGPDPAAIRLGKAYHYIVFKLFSLESDDREYRSTNYRLGQRYFRDEQHKFYRILAGELDNYGQPIGVKR